MQRYFLTQENLISKDDIHHIKNVMRFKEGTMVELCKDSKCFLSKLHISDTISFEKIEEIEDNPSLNITIVQGLPKGDKMDTVVKYATLFRAKEIIFMPMIRSIAKLSNEDHKLQRLSKIAKEASELAKLSNIPNIKFINKINDLNLDGKTIVLLDEEEKKIYIKDVIDSLYEKEIILVIGPEGGIDEKERIMYKKLNSISLSLGKTILPTELAHIPFLNAFFK